jgi:hypothetical protein
MSKACRYAAAEAFLRGHDEDWAALVDLIGPVVMTPKLPGSPMKPWCVQSLTIATDRKSG